MHAVCRNTWCQTSFEITEDDLAFYEKISPTFGGTTFPIPPPTLCPECRLQRRFSWRNDRTLYHRTCDKTGKNLISMFAPDSEATVYDKQYWWGDEWDARDFGQNVDFSRSFFEQFAELIRRAPYPHRMTVDDENSDYTNYTYKNKNCYLCFAGNFLEDSLFCYNGESSKDCTDCLFIENCELCYETIHSQNCYAVRHALHSRQCSDSAFLEGCSGLKNCFLCFNLHNKEYCILNEQYGKEGYEKKMKEFNLHTRRGSEEAFRLWREHSKKHPKRVHENMMSEDCVGEYITQGKNCTECYIMGKGCRDCRYVLNGFPRLQDAMDSTYCGEPGAELIYECMASGSQSSRLLFCNVCVVGSSNLMYCEVMFTSKNCFGCCNMRNAEYCILNKQYTKEEYAALVPKVIELMKSYGEYGEFFPISLSPYAYNETVASEFFPLTQEEAKRKTLRWRESENSVRNAAKSIGSDLLPDSITEVSDDISQHAVMCETTKRPFKIVKQELDFYRKMNIPLPRLHPDERHRQRMLLRNPRKLWSRTCQQCNKEIQTTYAPDRPETVVCEECYLKTVY